MSTKLIIRLDDDFLLQLICVACVCDIIQVINPGLGLCHRKIICVGNNGNCGKDAPNFCLELMEFGFLMQSHTHQPQMNYHSNNTEGR